jgi:hypothetical protein
MPEPTARATPPEPKPAATAPVRTARPKPAVTATTKKPDLLRDRE